ncbi:MAG: c-type cytochrome [Saprospiraceae bacterium]|nr:c-type cytochrome [Saprospiraceae bacterium]
MKKIFPTSALMLTATGLLAQSTTPADPGYFPDLFVRLILIVAGVVMVGSILVLYRLLVNVIRKEEELIMRAKGVAIPEPEVKPQGPSLLSRLYQRLTESVPVDREEDVMLDHGFDGIRELDNKLPPWWVALFYVTIIWGVGYMFYYHWGGSGPSSYEEYVEQVREGEEQAAAYLASQTSQIDEKNVTFLEDPAALEGGKTIFINNCAACHGQQGEGGVGPNFADDYYIHGGDIKDIFKVIKYGVPEKGMISWKSQLRPVDMQQVASYILSLRGTNPPNPKAPEGEPYQPPGGEGDQETGGTTDQKEGSSL